MRRCTSIAIGATFAGGCLNIPVHEGGPVDGPPPDAGRQPLVGVTVVGGEGLPPILEPVSVSAAEYEVSFPSAFADTVRLPDKIFLGTTDVLAHAPLCPGEDGVGLALYPVFAINASLPLSSTVNAETTTTISANVRGRAYAQVQVDWTHTYSCNPGAVVTVHALGTTAFTFFPDGRVIRSDEVTPTEWDLDSVMVGANNCGCTSSPGDFALNSYVAVKNAPFSVYRYADLSTPDVERGGDLTTAIDVDDPNPVWACLGHIDMTGEPTRRFGVAWTTPAAGPDGGTRVRSDGASNENSLFVHDWLHGVQAVFGSTAPADAQTALFLNTGPDADCAIGPLAEAFANPPRLEIASQLVDMDPRTGFYTPLLGMDPQPSVYTVQPQAEPIAPGFAFSLWLPTDATPTVMRGVTRLEADYDYLGQVDDVNDPDTWRHTFWFPAGLAPGEVLTVSQP